MRVLKFILLILVWVFLRQCAKEYWNAKHPVTDLSEQIVIPEPRPMEDSAYWEHRKIIDAPLNINPLEDDSLEKQFDPNYSGYDRFEHNPTDEDEWTGFYSD